VSAFEFGADEQLDLFDGEGIPLEVIRREGGAPTTGCPLFTSKLDIKASLQGAVEAFEEVYDSNLIASALSRLVMLGVEAAKGHSFDF